MISDLDLLQAVKESTSDAYVVYGELGREESVGLGLLALDRATNELVVLVVSTTTGTDGEVELGIDVRTELDTLVPKAGTVCVSCETPLRSGARFCQNCGTEVQAQDGLSDADPADMRGAVQDSISGDYELLGEMRRKESAGRVYFVREKSSGGITALRLKQGVVAGEFELAETRVM
ncbi:MAG: zinc ribbon domain-containing protein [Gemmatimonas sp.]